MNMSGTKPCASCGAQVADAALGRGAIEDPDGRRYCSPCAAKLLKSNKPEAQGLKAVAVARPVAAAPVPPGAAPRPKPSTRVVPPKAKSARIVAAPPAPVDAVLEIEEPVPVAPAPPAPAARVAKGVAPARKQSVVVRDSKSSRQDKNNTQARVSPSQRISRRASARSGLPWYTRLSRAQLIGACCGVGVVVLLVIIGMVVACRSPKKRSTGQAAVVDRPTRARMLIGEADQLYRQGKRDAALKKLREAAEDADAAGRGDLAAEARRLIYGINKGTPVSAN